MLVTVRTPLGSRSSTATAPEVAPPVLLTAIVKVAPASPWLKLPLCVSTMARLGGAPEVKRGSLGASEPWMVKVPDGEEPDGNTTQT